jgi:CRISPR-associated endonuclease/helicase Cas3
MKRASQMESRFLARFQKEFAALYDGDPFPWQERLFLELCKGDIPAALDLPTGLGKTSVMAIWLLARALGPDTAQNKIPRRLAYVVDRRVVVDQATTEAQKLQEWLEHSGTDLKPALNLVDRKLPISTLRGQLADNREWQENPAGCAIVIGTVDMIGSRILFSGYGVSPNVRPYHAGLLGVDTLAVLDESHLVRPFEALLERIQREPQCEAQHEFGPKSAQERQIVPPFRVICLSATGTRAAEAARVFSLTDEDYKHPIVRERLNAPKHLTIDEAPADDALAGRLADRAWALATEPRPARVLVYCDRRDDALKVADALQKRADRSHKIPTRLLVGDTRVHERQSLFTWLIEKRFVGAASESPDAAAFLIATSAGEVGVDLDADHMVCDLVQWERMVQRLGRVNRRGCKHARIDVIPASPSDKKKGAEDWEERRPDLAAPIKRLRVTAGGDYDASPKALAELRRDGSLMDLLRKAESSKPLHPALSRPLIDAWAMTSIEHHTGRPEVEPWLRGWEEDEQPRSIIAWRKFLPLVKGEKPSKEDIDDFFEAAPIHRTEMLETETWRAVDWIVARAMATAKVARTSAHGRTQNLAGENATAVLLLDHKARCEGDYSVAKLAELERKENRKARESFANEIAGRILVVSSRLAGLAANGVLDRAEDDEPATIEDEGTWTGPRPFRVRMTESAKAKDEDWHEFHRCAIERAEDGTEMRWIVVEQPRAQGQTQESLAVARKAQLLDKHRDQVLLAARQLARALSLPPLYVEMLEVAAKLHDDGKKSSRWQRAFNAPPGKVYAKTKGPVNLRLLDGYRHEFGSLLCAEANAEIEALRPDVRDLALHLIAAHHGNARPLISPRGCEAGPPSVLQDRACEAALRFGRLQKRWGPWGLAWWEGLLRSVDQRVSRENDASGERASEKLKVEEPV